MPQQPSRVGFVGAGAIARCHAFALAALPYYYDDAPEIAAARVLSARPERARSFARQFRFAAAASESEFWSDPELDTVFVLGPNRLHCEHARRALALPGIRRLYLEKPVCVTPEEAREMAQWRRRAPQVHFQTGFQLLQGAAIRRAWREWKAGSCGAAVQFELKLLHSGYLEPAYRASRASRLTPIPEGGAFVDLGSHLVSLAMAFLGPSLTTVHAHALSPFPELDPRSDMHTVVVVRDELSGAHGTLTASRVAAGHEDTLELEFSGERGAVRVRSAQPGDVELCTSPSRQDWTRVHCASDYGPRSRFPARGEPAGWLRPLIHAHYQLFGGTAEDEFLPDLDHGLAVQRVLHEVADRLHRAWPPERPSGP